MDGTIHESDARRERRDGTERTFVRVLSPNLQAIVPQNQARLRLRRRHPCSQAPHRHRPPQAPRQSRREGPKDRREVAPQSGQLFITA